MKQTHWIKVGDKMPKDAESILVLVHYWSPKYECWTWQIEQFIYFEEFPLEVHYPNQCKAKVTHWMPIELPEDFPLA